MKWSKIKFTNYFVPQNIWLNFKSDLVVFSVFSFSMENPKFRQDYAVRYSLLLYFYFFTYKFQFAWVNVFRILHLFKSWKMFFICLQVIFLFPPFLSSFFTMSDIVMLEQTVGNIIITKRKPSDKPSALSDDNEIDVVNATQKENSTTPRVTPVKRKEEPMKTEASPPKKPRHPVVKELALRTMSKNENPGGPSKTESGAEPDDLHRNFESAIGPVRQSIC